LAFDDLASKDDPEDRVEIYDVETVALSPAPPLKSADILPNRDKAAENFWRKRDTEMKALLTQPGEIQFPWTSQNFSDGKIRNANGYSLVWFPDQTIPEGKETVGALVKIQDQIVSELGSKNVF